MRRLKLVFAVAAMMAILLPIVATPAVADDDPDFDFDDSCCGFNFGFFPGTFGFSPFFNDGLVFDDVTFRNVRESSPRDDTCVLRTDGFFRTDDGLRCFF